HLHPPYTEAANRDPDTLKNHTTQAGLFQTSEVYKSAPQWRNSGLGNNCDRRSPYKDLGGLPRVHLTETLFML
ncbi:MAG: hypothetical protein U9R05_11560, partial [Chloroflexota bacterium]|nr:hypothetical protein [Chloroflexota bacterium]